MSLENKGNGFQYKKIAIEGIASKIKALENDGFEKIESSGGIETYKKGTECVILNKKTGEVRKSTFEDGGTFNVTGLGGV